LQEEAKRALLEVRRKIEDYIKVDPYFARTLTPYHPLPTAPSIIKEMARMARRVKVGPMAGVAGAIAEWVGRHLLKFSSEVIVENGGDIYLASSCPRVVKVFSGDSPFRKILSIKIPPEKTPIGICTSSGKIGHSLSFGNADAVVVISSSTILADVAATALGNRIKREEDVEKGIKWIKSIRGIEGVMVIIGKTMGVWGDIELV